MEIPKNIDLISLEEITEICGKIKQSILSKFEQTKAVDKEPREILYFELKMLNVVYTKIKEEIEAKIKKSMPKEKKIDQSENMDYV